MTESGTGGDAAEEEGSSSTAKSGRSNGDQAAMGCIGLVLLLVGMVIAMIAPAVGGLSSISDTSDRSFSASQPIPLDAHRRVAFELDTYGGGDLQDCRITGPGGYSVDKPLVVDRARFTTREKGDYHIACEGGDVTVQNDVSGNPAADIDEQHGRQTKVVLFVLGGVFFAVGLIVLAVSGRAARRPLDQEG